MGTLFSIGLVVAAVTLVFVATRSDSKRHQEPRETGEAPVTKPVGLRGRLTPKVKPGVLEERHRLRTDRWDLQVATNREFTARELAERVWPPLR